MLLITGANGQLGNELRLLLGDNALYTDYAELDITNAAEVRAFVNAHRVDMIVNCAAYTAVDKAESDEEKVYAINAVGPANLAQAGVPMWFLPDAVIHHKAGGSAGGMLSVYYITRNTLYLTCKGKSAAYAKLKTILPLLTGAARYALTKLLGRKKGRSYGAFRGAVDFWNGKMGRMEG